MTPKRYLSLTQDTQVYKYYRDLINFKTRGDPALMLKCINPREADLLDSAAGVHIKFRLAGEKFPPNIYYKIFTHRNIADIGAFAPRDYTHADNKRLPLNLVHNKGPQTKPGVLHCYERWENNGWRLVSDRVRIIQGHVTSRGLQPVVERMDQDTVVFESTQTTTMFHHHKNIGLPVCSSLWAGSPSKGLAYNWFFTLYYQMVRRQDLEKRRKQKKIEWMKKMYKQGMLRAKEAQDSETQNIIETVAKGMVNAAETRGNEAVEDWEVDELLEWTNGLNFDE
ncbi:hypothetical protein QZH41_010479 [Actinostola sp. cb2023]|nr:hypothetical protein QZH41_010479 [Actinostola sp. cb2023]